MYTSTSIATGKCLYLFYGYHIEITRDGMLESRCGYSKLECFALCGFGEESVYYAARERIAAAYAVDNRVYVVVL